MYVETCGEPILYEMLSMIGPELLYLLNKAWSSLKLTFRIITPQGPSHNIVKLFTHQQARGLVKLSFGINSHAQTRSFSTRFSVLLLDKSGALSHLLSELILVAKSRAFSYYFSKVLLI